MRKSKGFGRKKVGLLRQYQGLAQLVGESQGLSVMVLCPLIVFQPLLSSPQSRVGGKPPRMIVTLRLCLKHHGELASCGPKIALGQ